jgi:hypothetical protein
MLLDNIVRWLPRTAHLDVTSLTNNPLQEPIDRRLCEIGRDADRDPKAKGGTIFRMEKLARGDCGATMSIGISVERKFPLILLEKSLRPETGYVTKAC